MPQFDIVLFGATSFVGNILSHYMLEHYGDPGEVKWAIAGRSRQKLESLKQQMGEKGSNVEIIVADAADEEALQAMCNNTKVVVSTVGPYALYGEPLVKACVTQGTDYCDLTGEPQWIEKMIRRYESVAKVSGARIVHCCGFDSIPSDMGVYFLQKQAQEAFGIPCTEVKMRVKRIKGSASGGTVASITNLIKEASADPSLRRILTNPYALCPADHGYNSRQKNHKSFEYDEDFQSWSAPFVMAAINTRIVHRSNALLNDLYGKNFLYEEAMLTGAKTKGGIQAAMTSAGLGMFMLATAFPPTRWLLESFILPKPGEGPSKEAQQKGFYDIRFLGTTSDGRQIMTKVTGDRDPGYGSTAKMLGEAAVCLAKDIPEKGLRGGFWTPSSAFVDVLIPRLEEKAGLTFSKV